MISQTTYLSRAAICALIALSTLMVAACGGGGGPSMDAGSEASSDSGMLTDSMGLEDGGCAPGEAGCVCGPGETCEAGYCVSGSCIDCSAATEGCVCRSNGTCNAELRCEAMSGLCEACPPGEEGCACELGETCQGGLVCSAGVCAPSTCSEGLLGCPCAALDRGCEGGAYCSAMGLCERCATDIAGCPCEGGTCSEGFACEAGSCRVALSCDDLVLEGSCPEGARCDEGVGGDAICVADECGIDFRLDPFTLGCVPCLSAGCAEEPTCAPGLVNSLDAECLAQNRVCEELDGVAYCTECMGGYGDLGTGDCIAAIVCGGTLCPDTEYCDRTNPAGETCTPWPCASMDTVVDGSGACSVTCARDCAVEGSTGRPWPFADVGDSCICETLPGYFFDTGGVIAPVLCDADGDGWVRQEVQDLLDAASPDAAVVANARCTIREVDRVRLVDEYGVGSEISSCEEGLIQDLSTETCTRQPLRLFETQRNDVPGEAARLGEALPYAAGGRRLRAEELNSLTKACVSILGDYDHDGIEDIGQSQPMPADTSALGEGARLRSFAHFVELYTTAYEAPTGLEPYGTLIIAERSRCGSDFSLGYGADASYDAADASTYWRNCERRRDPSFNADAAGAGTDFGQWGCAARSGSCDASATPAHPSLASLPDPSAELLRDHGLCELGGDLPADGAWRGMNHQSQFKCVQVVIDGTATNTYDREQSAFAATGTLVMNACQVSDCAGASGCTDSIGPARIDAYSPILECAKIARGDAIADGVVGWAAITYQPYGHVATGGVPMGDTTYNGGCINEDAEYPSLCPDPEFGYCSAASESASGRYRCYGWDSLFLWGADTGSGARSTLMWAEEASGIDTLNMSVWNLEPAPSCG